MFYLMWSNKEKGEWSKKMSKMTSSGEKGFAYVANYNQHALEAYKPTSDLHYSSLEVYMLVITFQSPFTHFLVETPLLWVLLIGKVGESR